MADWQPMATFDPSRRALVHDRLVDQVIDWDPDRHGTSYAAHHRVLDDGVIAWDGLLLDGWRLAAADDVAAQLEEILGEADALIRQRLAEHAIAAPHLVVAVSPDGQVVLRSNVAPDGLRTFGEDLVDIADTLTAPPADGDTTH